MIFFCFEGWGSGFGQNPYYSSPIHRYTNPTITYLSTPRTKQRPIEPENGIGY